MVRLFHGFHDRLEMGDKVNQWGFYASGFLIQQVNRYFIINPSDYIVNIVRVVAFPASFLPMAELPTIARYGLDIVSPLNKRVKCWISQRWIKERVKIITINLSCPKRLAPSR